MEIEKKNSFPDEDGHIESILTGVDQLGTEAEINSAIFDVGYEYVSEQKCPYYE